MPNYIVRCHIEDSASVKAALRAEIMFRGDIPPWDEETDGRWFEATTDWEPLAGQVFKAALPFAVACYDGTRWLVPTVEGPWRESR